MNLIAVPTSELSTLNDAERIALYLYRNIKKNNPSFKEPKIESWVKDIDLAIRKDNRTPEQLKDAIDWIYSDKGTFWRKNILSGKKLRAQFDQMNMTAMNTKITRQEKREVMAKLSLHVNVFDLYENGTDEELAQYFETVKRVTA